MPMVNRGAILLGHLGDVALFSRMSNCFPGSIHLVTSTQFVELAKQVGSFTTVMAPEDPLAFVNAEVYTDLHDASCTITEYRRILNASTVQTRLTSTRAKWLRRQPLTTIEKRDHVNERLICYWIRTLDLPRGTPMRQYTANSTGRESAGRRIVVSIQTTAPHKKLSHRVLERLCARLAEEGAQLQFVVGPGSNLDAAERHVAARHEVVHIGTPLELISLLENTRVMVSVDSGLQHVARSFGKATIVIYGPTDPDIVGTSLDHYSVRSQSPCAPCGSTEGCPKHERPACLDDLQIVERVVNLWINIRASC